LGAAAAEGLGRALRAQEDGGDDDDHADSEEQVLEV
jgi:hypothetical protein